MEDERLSQIKQQQEEAINQNNSAYDNMIQNTEDLYNKQNEYANQYEETQNAALDKQLELFQDNINKQKEEAQKNYETETQKAQNDYISYTNPYGYQAETMASQGQLHSGLSETAKLGGYNTYQNRLATANSTMQKAFTEYDTQMNEAIANYDVQKAQNALARLEMILGFESERTNSQNTIEQNRLSTNQGLNSEYYGRYQDQINQINYENEQAEAIRQFNEQLAYQKERDAVEDAQWQKEYNLAKQSTSKSSSSSLSSSTTSTGSTSLTNSSSTTIKTDYYSGEINPDVQYGTFGTKDKNGVNYQPDNVGGDKLTSAGVKVKDVLGTGTTGKSGAILDNQTVWETSNGDLYVWDGSQNKYIFITNHKTFSFSYNENYEGISSGNSSTGSSGRRG